MDAEIKKALANIMRRKREIKQKYGYDDEPEEKRKGGNAPRRASAAVFDKSFYGSRERFRLYDDEEDIDDIDNIW